MVFLFVVILFGAALAVLAVVTRDGPSEGSGLSMESRRAITRIVEELRRSLEAGAISQQTLETLAGCHALLSRRPSAEQVRALSVLTWAANFLGLPGASASGQALGALVGRGLRVTGDDVRAAAVSEFEARALRELALQLAHPSLPGRPAGS